MASRKKPVSASQHGVVAASSTRNQGREAFNLEIGGSRASERATPDPGLVERLAYALWEERGRPDGSADDDWLRAEQLLREDSVR